MEWLSDFFSGFTSDIASFFSQLAQWCMYTAVTQYIEFKIWFIQTAWAAAKDVLVAYDFSSLISMGFNYLPDDVRSYLISLDVPEGLTVVSQAFVTRFIMNRFGRL